MKIFVVPGDGIGPEITNAAMMQSVAMLMDHIGAKERAHVSKKLLIPCS